MPRKFSIPERIIGFSAETIPAGGVGKIITTEWVTSHDGAKLTSRLEHLDASIFSHIPDLPPRSTINDLLVVIDPKLNATAYVNELRPIGTAKITRNIERGEKLSTNDISEIHSYETGVEIPEDAAFVFVQSFGWRKALVYDLRPLDATAGLRQFDINTFLAHVYTALVKIPIDPNATSKPEDTSTIAPNATSKPEDTSEPEDASTKGPNATSKPEDTSTDTSTTDTLPQAPHMGEGLAELRKLLSEECQQEAKYQELLQKHPWMLYGLYKSIQRHPKMDDANIPDFVGVRHKDNCLDIIELKQPFIEIVRKSGGLTQEFSDAWSQVERYLDYAQTETDTLRRQKYMEFQNPRCILLAGYRLPRQAIAEIGRKQKFNSAIELITYDQLARVAEAILDFTLQQIYAPAPKDGTKES